MLYPLFVMSTFYYCEIITHHPLSSRGTNRFSEHLENSDPPKLENSDPLKNSEIHFHQCGEMLYPLFVQCLPF